MMDKLPLETSVTLRAQLMDEIADENVKKIMLDLDIPESLPPESVIFLNKDVLELHIKLAYIRGLKFGCVYAGNTIADKIRNEQSDSGGK